MQECSELGIQYVSCLLKIQLYTYNCSVVINKAFFNVFTVICMASQDSVFDIRLYGESHYDVEPPKRGKWVELARCVRNTE